MIMAACNNPLAVVSEYCAGGSLYNVLHQQKKKLTLLEVLTYASDMAAGLSYLHAQHIVHRDVKSLNMLLDRHNNIKVADFGLTKSRSSGEPLCGFGLPLSLVVVVVVVVVAAQSSLWNLLFTVTHSRRFSLVADEHCCGDVSVDGARSDDGRGVHGEG